MCIQVIRTQKKFCMRFDSFIRKFHASASPHSGRVFKIHLKFPHENGKVLVWQRQLIFNIQSSKIAV